PMGRAFRIRKRSNHVTIIVAQREVKVKSPVAPKKQEAQAAPKASEQTEAATAKPKAKKAPAKKKSSKTTEA
ncbi:MAG TPA: 50S ribosomal protein L22, partial [Bacteroidota bacterium]